MGGGAGSNLDGGAEDYSPLVVEQNQRAEIMLVSCF